MERPGVVRAVRALVFLVGGMLVFPAAVADAAAAPAEQHVSQWRLRDDAAGDLPTIRAAAAVIYDPITQEILYAENAEDQRSIASITKVMTALIVLESEPDLSRRIQITPADVRRASHTYLRARERVSINELLHLMLIGSDNAAARAIARDSVLGYDGFLDVMNQKAAALGLASTRYADPSGLDADNLSSAYDMARLISFAAASERIARIMRTREYELRINRRRVKLENTNKLLEGDLDVQGGKTGFIRKAGYCLAALLRLPTGDPIAVVVLGARSNRARFLEAQHLFDWLIARSAPLLAAPTASQP